ncbi:hypothetical protein PISL3812_09959 [Talaromyces islandicus]|uniref:Uncharacterized protein n=1 Tax=Talaromyces islandicus TaxID=28573 RepID=A0A0U1MB97_TALIS|nr:hypothetical protein PISL3812_09959 [Talaromyces islandicus]
MSFPIDVSNRMSTSERAADAEEILNLCLAECDHLEEFFTNDWSLIHSKFGQKIGLDARRISLLPTLQDEDPWEGQLRRLTGSRHLAEEEETCLAKDGYTLENATSLPNYYRQGPDFLREQGLWNDRETISKGLSQGHKLRRIERAIGFEGISLALLPAFPRFPHLALDQETRLIFLLRNENRFEKILKLGSMLSSFSRSYQNWTNYQLRQSLALNNRVQTAN